MLKLPPWSVSVEDPSTHSVPVPSARIEFRTAAAPPSSAMAAPLATLSLNVLLTIVSPVAAWMAPPRPAMLSLNVLFVLDTLDASIAPPRPAATFPTNVLATTVTGAALPAATAPPDAAWLPASVERTMLTAPPWVASTAPPAPFERPFCSARLTRPKATPPPTENRRTFPPPSMVTERSVASRTTGFETANVVVSVIVASQAKRTVPPAAIAAARWARSQIVTMAEPPCLARAPQYTWPPDTSRMTALPPFSSAACAAVRAFVRATVPLAVVSSDGRVTIRVDRTAHVPRKSVSV